MPRYDYRCGACGTVYEKREGFDAPSVQVCPECSGTARRVLTPPAIVFKGSGWYVTDSRKGSPDGDSSKSPSTPASTTNGKTESAASSTSSPSASSDSTTKTDKSSA
jgi:putative FmdB family regulatory protein